MKYALEFQQMTEEVLRSNQGLFGTIQLTTNEWFELSRYLVLLLRKIALRGSKNLITFASIVGIDSEDLCRPATGLALELLPTHERSLLLDGMGKIIISGPQSFIAAAEEANLNQSFFCGRGERVPNSIKTLTSHLPEQRKVRATLRSIDHPKPASETAVRRMYARLIRRISMKDHPL